MIECLKKILQKYPERTAYTYHGEKISYLELLERAQKTAKILFEDDNSPVAVIGGKNPEVMAAILGCILAERAYVPINANIPEERKNRIIKASKAGTVIDCTGKSRVFEKMENGAQTGEENETAYIIFTSGSTGKPKGVPISYKNLDNFINWITKFEPMNKFEHAKVFNQADFGFDLSTATICYALFGGHEIVQAADGNDFFENLEIIKRNKPEVFVVTPTFFRLCLLEKDFCEREYPFIKCVYFCGEMLQKSLVYAIFERFPKIRIINAYGPTEATSAVCAVEITKEMCEHEEILPVGKMSTAATEIKIENGEIVLRGASVFSGYLENEVGLGSVSDYRTGDLGFVHGDFIYCKGRKDGQIKYKGYRIELSEIEEEISSVDGVENCAAVAKRNPEGEVKMIKAFFSGTAEEEEIRKKLLNTLPEYMIPKIISRLEKLPINENGKTDRKELLKL